MTFGIFKSTVGALTSTFNGKIFLVSLTSDFASLILTLGALTSIFCVFISTFGALTPLISPVISGDLIFTSFCFVTLLDFLLSSLISSFTGILPDILIFPSFPLISILVL